MTSRRGPVPALLMALALIAASLLGAPTQRGAEAGDGWWGGLDEGEAVSLANIMAGPADFRGRTLTFFCLFHRKESYFDPVRTPFSQKRYDNFSAWPDGAPVWEQEAYAEGDLPFLYVPSTHVQRDDLMQLDTFTRIEVTGRIRDLLRGRPTIEVFSFRTTGHRVGKTVMKDIMRGHNYARMGTEQGYQLAARSFKRALTPDLPPLYEIAVRKLLAQSLRKLGHMDEAAAYENGESYGTPDLPEPRTDGHVPEASEFPRQPVGLVGSPDGEEPSQPRTSPGERGSSYPPAPAATGLTGESDLPGAPVGPITSESDLPGTPGQAQPVALPGRTPGDASAGRGGLPPPRIPGKAPAHAAGDWPPAAPRLPGPLGDRTAAQPPASPSGLPVAKPDTPKPVRSGPVSGIPPSRTPRLTGVR